MASSFPTNLDSFTTKQDDVDNVLASHVNDLQNAVVAAQTKIGINSSADTNSIDYKVSHIPSQVEDNITDGHTTIAPSGNAVFDALALKATLDSPVFTTKIQTPTIELGHASDTTLARVSAGVVSVEGVTVPTISSANTVTNKRNQKRVYSTTSLSTLTPEIDTYDVFCLTAQAAALSIANHSTSTPANGEMILIRILDNGTARAISFGTNYVAKAGVALPTTTVLSKNMSMLFIWDSNLSKYNLLSVGQE